MKSNKYRKEDAGIKSRIVACALLFCMSVNIGAQSFSGIKGFDRNIYSYHFDTADKEITPERWLEKAREGIEIARASWERLAVDLFAQNDEYAQALADVHAWSEEELERRYADWIQKRFLQHELDGRINQFAQKTEREFLELYFHLDETGNIVSDTAGDSSLVRPGERGTNEDRDYVNSALTQNAAAAAEDYAASLDDIFPELLAYIAPERRDSVRALLAEAAQNTGAALRRELAEIHEREERLFVSRRVADTYSLRNKSEREAASAVADDLIFEAELVCNSGINDLEARIEAAKAGAGNLALLGEEWLTQYEEQFNRGLKAWEDAEERFFLRQIEWQRQASEQMKAGEDAWAEAFTQFAQEQKKWEKKAAALLDAGEKLFTNASQNLQKAINEARAQFAVDSAARAESGRVRAEAYLTTYLTAGGIVSEAQENIDFWLETYIHNLKTQPSDTPPSLKSGNFRQWFESIESGDTLQTNINSYTEQLTLLAQLLTQKKETLPQKKSQAEAKQNELTQYQNDNKTMLSKNMTLSGSNVSASAAAEYAAWFAIKTHATNLSNELKALKKEIADLEAEIPRIEKNIIEQESVIAEARSMLNVRQNAALEITRWIELYERYMPKALDARNALVNDFDIVMGDGKLADILGANVSSEDFALDEYQVELIRAQAVSKYWSDKLEIAKALDKYAADLSANRITDAEGIKAREAAKAAYDTAVAAYDDAIQILNTKAENVETAKQAVETAQNALSAAEAELDELNKRYMTNKMLLLTQDDKAVLNSVMETYKELLKAHKIFDTSETPAYLQYIEKAYTLGRARFVEAQGEALKFMIKGNDYIKSLADLRSDWGKISVPPQTNAEAGGAKPYEVYEDISDYDISENDMYYKMIEYFMSSRDKDINDLNTKKKEIDESTVLNDDDTAGNVEFDYETEKAAIEKAWNEKIYNTALAAKNTAYSGLNGRFAALSLLTAAATASWCAEFLGDKFTDADRQTLEEKGLYQLLKAKEYAAEEAYKDFLDAEERKDMNTYEKSYAAKELRSEYELYSALLGAYNFAESGSAAIAKEEKDFALANINAIFSGAGITLQGGGFSMPDVKNIADSILSNAALDTTKSIDVHISEFIYKLDAQFQRLPALVHSEFNTWKETFIEYIAAKLIYNNKVLSETSAAVQTKIDTERAKGAGNHNTKSEEEILANSAEEIERLSNEANSVDWSKIHKWQVQYALLAAVEQLQAQKTTVEQEKIRFEENRPAAMENIQYAEHWRQSISEGMRTAFNAENKDGTVDAGIKNKPEDVLTQMKWADSFCEGLLADKIESARFASSALNAMIQEFNKDEYWTAAAAVAGAAQQHKTNASAQWDESVVVRAENGLTDAFSAEKSKLSRKQAEYEGLQKELLRFGSAYRSGLMGSVFIEREMKAINLKIEELTKDIEEKDANGNPTGNKTKSEYTLRLDTYKQAVEAFMNAGALYDDAYTSSKNKYNKMESARFEYEKQDAIRRWAATSYLDGYDELKDYGIQYRNPAQELIYCQERYNRAQGLLTALSEMYQNEEKRPFNDAEYNAKYEEVQKSFERLKFSMRIRDTLNEAIREETKNNEKLYSDYRKEYEKIAGRFDASIINSPSDERIKWQIYNIISIDEEGRLKFNTASFTVQPHTSEEKQTLTDYFTNAVDKYGDKYKSGGIQTEQNNITEFELAVRKLSKNMQDYITSVEKYENWSLARDYLIRSLQKNNKGGNAIDFVNNAYTPPQGLLGGFGNMKANWTNQQVSNIALGENALFSLQEQAWNNLTEDEKKDLEFYTILCLMQDNGDAKKCFENGYATALKQYEDAYNKIDKNYNTTRIIGTVLVFTIPVLGLVMLSTLDDIAVARNAVSNLANNAKNELNKGFAALEDNTKNIQGKYGSYKNSSDRLSKLKGDKAPGQYITWTDIKTSLQTAKVSAEDIAQTKVHWNDMTHNSSEQYTSVQDAMVKLAQWAREKKDEANTALENCWKVAETERLKKQDTYRQLSQLYIENKTSLGNVTAAMNNAYGNAAPAWKNHLSNIGITLVNSIDGAVDDGSTYSNEYTEIAADLVTLIERAYIMRYNAELQARQAEWEQQAADLTQKLGEWRNASALILARGRDDWQKSVEHLRGQYKLWQSRFSDEYERVDANWSAAYLAGLREKEAWVADAAAAAQNAASGAMLEKLGADAQTRSRAFDTNVNTDMDVEDARAKGEAAILQIMNSAGIANMRSAFAGMSSAANTVASKIRSGLGGAGLWNSSNVQRETRLLVSGANRALAEREAKKLAETVRRNAEANIQIIYEKVDEANKQFNDSMDGMFLHRSGWARTGSRYVKDVLIDSTVINGAQTERAIVDVYKFYEQREKYVLPEYLNPAELDGLEASAINTLLAKFEKELNEFLTTIFGDGEKGSANKGTFGEYQGEQPTMRDDPDPINTSIDYYFSGSGNRGSGELGRLMRHYIYWEFREGNGISAMNTPVWEQNLWHKKEGDWFDPPNIKSLASIALQVVGTIAFPGVGGLLSSALLGMVDDVVFGSLDMICGYKSPLEAGFEFGKQALISLATDKINAMSGGIAGKLGDGLGNLALKSLVKAGEVWTTSTITSTLSSVTFSEKNGFGFETDSFMDTLKNSWRGAALAGVNTFADGLNLGGKLDKLAGSNDTLKAISTKWNDFASTGLGGFTSDIFNGLANNVSNLATDVILYKKDILEAGFNWGKQALGAAAAGAVNRAADGITSGFGGNLGGLALRSLVNAGESFTIGTITNTLDSLNFTTDGGFGFDTKGFTDNMDGIYKSSLAVGAKTLADGTSARITEKIHNVIDAGTDKIKSLINKLPGIDAATPIGAIAGRLTNWSGKAGGFINNLSGWAGRTGNFADTLAGWTDNNGAKINAMLNSVQEKAAGTVDGIRDKTNAVINDVTGMAEDMADGITDALSDEFSDITGRNAPSISNPFSGMGANASNSISGLSDDINSKSAGVFDSITRFVSQNSAGVSQFLKRISGQADGVQDFLAGLSGGTNAFSNFVLSLSEKAATVNKYKDFLNNGVDWGKDALTTFVDAKMDEALNHINREAEKAKPAYTKPGDFNFEDYIYRLNTADLANFAMIPKYDKNNVLF
ncbi:MAG: hypothetical protein LBG72_05525 [Spirochaetaceae bacterium]|nr:hypothetical protein [Spirochaetaceae bacterium]